MAEGLLICTDLDRTLIPNGEAEESPQARTRFAKLAVRPEITLVYVSGRHLELIVEAVRDYNLPRPDYVVADVGSSIYTFSEKINKKKPKPWTNWRETLARDWAGQSPQDIQALFRDLSDLRLQEAAKQNDFKVSYDAPIDIDSERLLHTMQQRLSQRRLQARLIWSVDEKSKVGLLDILPAQASKYHALAFMMKQLGFSAEHTVFSGDSGNDMEVLISPIPAVLVANSTDEVKTQARHLSEKEGTSHALYLAGGGFLGMNGNYRGGILEGIAHYVPASQAWMACEEGKKT